MKNKQHLTELDINKLVKLSKFMYSLDYFLVIVYQLKLLRKTRDLLL